MLPMSDSRKRQVKRIVNAAMKSEKPAPGHSEHGGDRVGHPLRDVLRALLHVVRGPRIAQKRELVRLLQILRRSPAGPGGSPAPTPTIRTRKSSPSTVTRAAAPSTVTVAARPRDNPVLPITSRTGNSNTSARKMPTKTTRKVSPMATNAAITASVANMSTTVRSGSDELHPTALARLHGAERYAFGRTLA